MDAKIKSTIWEDDEFSMLDAQGKVIFFWLITCQGTNNIGYVEVSKRAFEADTGSPLEGLARVLKGLPRAFHFDEVNGRYRVWVRHYIRHQWPPGSLEASSNVFKNLRSHFFALPDPFQSVFEGAYKGLVRSFKGLPEAEGSYKGLIRVPKGQEQNSTVQNSTEHRGMGSGERGLKEMKELG